MDAQGDRPVQDGAGSGITCVSSSGSIDDQGQWSGAPAAQEEDEEEDESLITEILTAAMPKLVDSSVACLISWAGDDIIDRGEYYEPSMVRIGPFHRQDPSKRSADRTEQKKKLVLRGLLASSSKEEDEAAAAGRREELRSHLEAMERMELDARRCYNRSFSWMTSKEFARMLLLDGCFLYSRFVSSSGDDIAVDRDVMFLLENQIPFFVLEKIHQRLNSTSGEVLDKVAKRVQQVLQRSSYIALTNLPSAAPPCHLLHLLHMYFTPTATLDSGSPKQTELLPAVVHANNNDGQHSIRVPVPPVRWRRATQYDAAGVGFVKRKLGDDGARSILDVELIRDQLHIPCLIIDSNTFRLLRNMVVMEQKSLQQQASSQRSSHVTAYCLFLSQLANTEEDVELLVSKGIIVHLLRSNGDVAEGLAGLCDGVVIDAYDPDVSYLRSKHEALEKLVCSGARAAQEKDEKEDESLITEILTAAMPKLVDSSVACLISWAGDDIVDRGEYYEPSMVRIGPFHRQDPSKRPADRTEQKKKRVLRSFLTSDEQDEAGRREELRSHLEAMQAIETKARRYYSRSFKWMSSKEFAGMLLLDGCYLYSRFVSSSGDDIAVDRDVMFLLENQIPFFVLEKIHQQLIKTGKVQDTGPPVLDKVAQRVQQVLQRSSYTPLTNLPGAAPPCHLLHLLYMYFTPTMKRKPGSNGTILEVEVPTTPAPARRPGSIGWCISVDDDQVKVRWRRATQYYAAGVGFVKRKLGDDGVRSILDVELTAGWLTGGGTLHVPCLTIDINTFRMLRNMVALEQKSLQPQRSSHVTAYCFFLSQVAGTKEDVELLVSKGVIAHLLSSVDDVARGLAGLCDGVVLEADDLNYLSSKHKALEPLYHSNWGRSIAWLWHVKCDNPLKAMAVLAAVVVSIANVLQLVFAGLSYGRGK